MAAETEASGNITRLLATFVAELDYQQLPPTTVSALKDIVLDTFGTSLAATSLGAGCHEIAEMARASGGVAESTVLGFGDRVPVLMAALANGALAHAMTYDSQGPGHCGGLMPAPLAVAERVGGVSGREFLAALAGAIELTGRVNRSLSRAGVNANEKFLEGQLVNFLGAAGAAGRVMRLTPKQMHSALGFALMQASGSMQVVFEGDPPCKGIYAAFPNHGGVLSALLSKQGIGAEFDVLEGTAGFYALFYSGKYVREALYEGLGEEFCAVDVRFKRWPTGGGADAFIEAALRLREEHSLHAAEIERVHLRISPRSIPWVAPEERRVPTNPAGASNSLPFWTATALANGRCGLSDLTPAGLAQPETLRLTRSLDYSLLEHQGEKPQIEVLTSSGDRYASQVGTTGGDHTRMTHEELVEKFRDCASYAVRPISQEALDEAIDLIDHLEDVPDIGVLPPLLVGGSG